MELRENLLACDSLSPLQSERSAKTWPSSPQHSTAQLLVSWTEEQCKLQAKYFYIQDVGLTFKSGYYTARGLENVAGRTLFCTLPKNLKSISKGDTAFEKK